MQLTRFQQEYVDFNHAQAVGEPLVTLKGSKIRRSKYKVGKSIGGKIYLHRSYYSVLPLKVQQYYLTNKDKVPFNFTCLRYDPHTDELAFVECSDFDTAREPTVGRIFTIDEYGNQHCSRSYQQIYHHKWAWVKNDYRGFDVEESWRWSAKWLSTLTVKADGSCLKNWLDQLKDFDLE